MLDAVSVSHKHNSAQRNGHVIGASINCQYSKLHCLIIISSCGTTGGRAIAIPWLPEAASRWSMHLHQHVCGDPNLMLGIMVN